MKTSVDTKVREREKERVPYYGILLWIHPLHETFHKKRTHQHYLVVSITPKCMTYRDNAYLKVRDYCVKLTFYIGNKSLTKYLQYKTLEYHRKKYKNCITKLNYIEFGIQNDMKKIKENYIKLFHRTHTNNCIKQYSVVILSFYI